MVDCVFVFEAAQKTDTCGVRSLVQCVSVFEAGTCGVMSLIHCVFVFEAAQKTNSHLWGEVSCVLCAFL